MTLSLFLSLFFPVTSSGFQNKSLKTVLSTFTMARGLQNLLEACTFNLAKSELLKELQLQNLHTDICQHLAESNYSFPSCLR